MANRDVEQILLEEHRRLMSGTGSAKPSGLLDAVKTVSSAPKASSPTPVRPASLKPTLAAAAGAPPSASSINRGYTLPAPQFASPQATAGSSVAGQIGKTALTIFTSGLGLMPLVSGLAGLFGGGGSTTPAPLVKFAMPRPIQVTAANAKDGAALSFADYNQDGTVRSFGGGNSDSGGTAPASPAAQAQSGTSGGQIVVNVQAMDSRSFLDHSQEIAQAVREAMLNMHALNDVVSEI